MTQSRCLHGMDSRFCAICTRAARVGFGASAQAAGETLAEVLRFLSDERSRAIYGAVASVLRTPPRSMGALLGTSEMTAARMFSPRRCRALRRRKPNDDRP